MDVPVPVPPWSRSACRSVGLTSVNAVTMFLKFMLSFMDRVDAGPRHTGQVAELSSALLLRCWNSRFRLILVARAPPIRSLRERRAAS